MTCIPDDDALRPYKPEPADDHAIGHLKRRLALLQAELDCYRELLPGLRYSVRYRILVDERAGEFDEGDGL